MTDLTKLSNKELVGIYNGLYPNRPLKSWKGKKSLIISRIKDMTNEYDEKPAPQIEMNQHSTFDPVSDEVIEKQSGWSHLASNAVKEPELVPVTDADFRPISRGTTTPDKVGESKVTIKDLAVKLLCFVSHHEDIDSKRAIDEYAPYAGSVGLSYAEILEKIKHEFPGCKTTASCLRWYAVQIRNGEQGYAGLSLPRRRPRS